MKLKYNFIVRTVAGQSVALAIGNDSKNFNGMIKLNSVGEYIFSMLKTPTTEEEIISRLTEKYEVTEDNAKTALENYLKVLRENDLIEE